MKITMTKKEFFKDYLLCIVGELAVLFALIFFCAAFIYKGEYIIEPRFVVDEMTEPTLGRFIYFILAFVLFLVLSVIASKLATKGNDVYAFWCGFAAGILLWQSVGEEAWHFGVGEAHFAFLENISTLTFVILFACLLIYGYKKQCFDWGIWIMLVSFACNWYGHFVTLGLYSFVEDYIESRTWNIYFGSICGGILFILSIVYLLRHNSTQKGRMFSSVLTFIAMGVVAFSIMEG